MELFAHNAERPQQRLQRRLHGSVITGLCLEPYFALTLCSLAPCQEERADFVHSLYRKLRGSL